MSESRIKVTDRRMFTPDGQLREEFRKSESPSSSPKPSAPVEIIESSADPAKPSGPISGGSGPGPEPELDTDASFRDLVAILAQTASTYLGQAAQMGPHPQVIEVIEMARLHVDLLRILKHKTSGNLAPTEQSLLDDALSSLRQAVMDYG